MVHERFLETRINDRDFSGEKRRKDRLLNFDWSLNNCEVSVVNRQFPRKPLARNVKVFNEKLGPKKV
jgi:hypothetical protein